MTKVEQINSEFTNWLRKFIEANQIDFSCAETFFNLLISSLLEEEIDRISIDMNNCILQIKDNVSNFMLDEGLLFSKMGDPVSEDKEFEPKPIKMLPLLDSEEV